MKVGYAFAASYVLLYCAEHLILSAANCQCEQNFVLPGFDLPQIEGKADYNHSLCFICHQNSFSIEAMGNAQKPVTMNTSLVMISTTLVPARFVLVIPDPRSALGNGSAAIACDGESYLISELSEERTQCI